MGRVMKRVRRGRTEIINRSPRIKFAVFAAGAALLMAGCRCEKIENRKIKEKRAVAAKNIGGEVKEKPNVPVECRIAKRKPVKKLKAKRINSGKTLIIGLDETGVLGSFKITNINKQGVFFEVCVPENSIDGNLLLKRGERTKIGGFGIEIHSANSKKKTAVITIAPLTVMADANGTGKKNKAGKR